MKPLTAAILAAAAILITWMCRDSAIEIRVIHSFDLRGIVKSIEPAPAAAETKTPPRIARHNPMER